MHPACLFFAPLFALAAASVGPAQDHEAFLPPALDWAGASRALALSPDHPWATPAERTGLERTPRYEETVAWLRQLAAAAPEIDMVSIGTSAEGREIWMAVASRANARTPEGLEAHGKPIVLAQAGIHSGEIDGKDAGLMLLRDMTVLGTRRELLDAASFLFVPILSVDGHERFSAHSRINQRGPEEMGWRTNARNLNLNRDYTKLETEEVRAVVRVIERWRPDLYVDLHVTDGADYQYDVTWGGPLEYGWSPNAARWIEQVMAPLVDARLRESGHVPGPLVWPVDGEDPANGNLVWMGTPRFSNVYGAARHLPTILVENHSLKPYPQRVLGTYVFLEALLEVVGREAASLAAATRADRARRPDPVALDWEVGDPPRVERRPFLGVGIERVASPVTGTDVVRWTGEPVSQEVPFVFGDAVKASASRPVAYLIPPAWSHVADKLRAHGIAVTTLPEPVTREVEVYRLPGAGLAAGGSAFDDRAAVYEGRVRVDPGEVVVAREARELPRGTLRVQTDQPLGTLAVLLLEPASPDSLFQWGFFLEMLTPSEYVEAYVMEPMARAMLEADPELARRFAEKLQADPAFAADPRARLSWFYARTPYWDARYREYPILRQVD